MDITSNEEQPLERVIRVYRRRWWILTVFCLACSVQGMIWNTWGPIAESSEVAFGWNDGNVALVTNLANISYLVFVLPACILMDTKGLRFSMLLCTTMIMTGSVLRIFSLKPAIATTTAYICGTIQGIAATIPFSGPPLVAAVWFPASERPTATAISSFSNYLGISLSFIVGPRLVVEPLYLDNSKNHVSNTTEVVNISQLKQGIFNVLYTHSALAGLAFILTIVYFPAKPPYPPSITSSIQRTNCRKAFLKLIRNGALWLIVLAGSIPIGVLGVWVAILDVVVKPLGVTQIDAGWMGFWNILIGCFSGIFIAKFSDLFKRRLKIFLVILYICGTICSVLFTLLCNGVIKHNLTAFYAICTLLGIFINGSTPLFYEISVETSYPVAEGMTGGFYTFVMNLVAILFLMFASIPSLGIEWMNWTVTGSIALVIPMLIVFPERYNRTDIDLELNTDKPSN